MSNKRFNIENKEVTIHNEGDEFVSILPKGWYEIQPVSIDMLSSMLKIFQTDIPVLPKSALKVANYYFDLSILDKFFSKQSEEFHKKIKMLQKMSILFHGRQGTAKTTTMKVIAQYMHDKYDAIVFEADDHKDYSLIAHHMRYSRLNGDNKPFVVILDECEHVMKNFEPSMKKFLDGHEDLNKCLLLFSTNYLDIIPDTIKDRPSRIKYSITVDEFTDPVVIFLILKDLNDSLNKDIALSDQKIRSMAESLIGSTMDQIKNKYIDTVFEDNIDIPSTIESRGKGKQKLLQEKKS